MKSRLVDACDNNLKFEDVLDKMDTTPAFNSRKDRWLKLLNRSYSYRKNGEDAFPDFEAALDLLLWHELDNQATATRGTPMIGMLWGRDGTTRVLELWVFG